MHKSAQEVITYNEHYQLDTSKVLCSEVTPENAIGHCHLLSSVMQFLSLSSYRI